MSLKYVMTNGQYGTQLWGGYKCLHTKRTSSNDEVRHFIRLIVKYSYFLPESRGTLDVISNVRHRVIGIQTVCGSLSLHKHCEMQSCAEKTAISVQWGSLWNSTPQPLLCTARGGKTNRSTCIKRSSPHWESAGFESIVRKQLSGNSGTQDIRPIWTWSPLLPVRKDFFSCPLCFPHSELSTCSYRQRIASLPCTSRSLDTLGKFTQGRSPWTPTPSRIYPRILPAKGSTLSVRVRAPLPPVALVTNP